MTALERLVREYIAGEIEAERQRFIDLAPMSTEDRITARAFRHCSQLVLAPQSDGTVVTQIARA